MSAQHNPSGAIAGLCFLGCALIVALAYAMTLIRTYGPVAREFLLWAITPQFAMGMFTMAFLASLCALGRVRP